MYADTYKPSCAVDGPFSAVDIPFPSHTLPGRSGALIALLCLSNHRGCSRYGSWLLRHRKGMNTCSAVRCTMVEGTCTTGS